MKTYIATVFLGLGLSQVALGGHPAPPAAPYINYATVTQAPVIDAPSFLNAGTFAIDSVASYNLTNGNYVFGISTSVLPYMTQGTLYFTNTGLMSDYPGFRFDTVLPKTRHSASFFVNAGTVEGFDTAAFLYLYPRSANTAVVVPGDSQPVASQLLVLSTNIVNTGTMSVGSAGLLSMVGRNVTNSYASLTAGSINTAGTNIDLSDPPDPTGLQGQQWNADPSGQYFFLDSPGVYDLFWGVNNALALNLPQFTPPSSVSNNNIAVTARGKGFGPTIPLNTNAAWSVSVYSNVYQGTNIFINVVFVNTNLSDPNISAAVAFNQNAKPPVQSIQPPVLANARESIVQFSEPVYDVIAGQTVTNGFYFIDDGAYAESLNVSENGSEAGNYGRPNTFALTTSTPTNWLASVPSNFPYNPNIFYASQEFLNQTVPCAVGEYGAQIGRNPSELDGSFSSLVAQDSSAYSYLLANFVNLPDPTNEAARIEITGANVDLTQTRLRAEGMVILNATNLVGVGGAAFDWGQFNGALGSTNGALVVSNIFPSTFQRVRGDIYAWSATFLNIQTNFGSFAGGNNYAPVANYIYYHVLVLDQNLFGTFASTTRNLKLTGKNSIVLQDNLNVINQVALDTGNLVVNSTNYFSQKAANFTPANTPGLTNLFIGPSGLLRASNNLAVGFNINHGQTSPAGRHYAVNSIANFGQMIATAPLLESSFFQNTGQITSDNNGSMIIEANELSLGVPLSSLTGYIDSQTNVLGMALNYSTNYLLAASSIYLSGATIEASNSFITVGTAGEGSLTLDATKELTDFVSGTPTTNTNSVIINHWSVTGGFSLPIKPAAGDLFRTEIHTMVTGFQQSIHVWAGADRGATNAGFVNNVVIGRLVLDRQSAGSVLRFSAVGAKNAMYVDYLELTNFALSNYRENLVIDSNFKIYFADSNADPEKLMQVYPGLVWVRTFAGPNSTQVVPYYESSNVCLMNAALAQSTEISFFNGVANHYNQPFVLNNPNNLSETYPCPGNGSAVPSILVTTPAAGGGGGALNLLNFPLLRGAYNGLFSVAGGATLGSSGAFILTMSGSGSFSGRLLMGPSVYNFNSQFNSAGEAQFQARSGARSLTVNLQLDMTGQTGLIQGDVNGGTWDAVLQADFQPAWTAQNPSPLAGSYTMVLPWAAGGDSYGVGTVSKEGVLSMAGTLADGATFSVSAPVSQSGRWPFCFYAAAGGDSVLGWVSVSNGLFSTNISWSKAAGKGPLYAAGFSNVLQLAGSPWQTPASGSAALTLTNPAVILSGGNLLGPQTIPVTLQNFLTFAGTNLSLSIHPSNGSFSGWFISPGALGRKTISGVVLQNEGRALGLFPGTNESGSVLLEGQ